MSGTQLLLTRDVLSLFSFVCGHVQVAQPPEPQHQKDSVDGGGGSTYLPASPSPWQPLG